MSLLDKKYELEKEISSLKAAVNDKLEKLNIGNLNDLTIEKLDTLKECDIYEIHADIKIINQKTKQLNSVLKEILDDLPDDDNEDI